MPGLIVLMSVALFVLSLFPSHHLPHVLFGVLTAWLYLRYSCLQRFITPNYATRFFQKKGEVTGDLSDSFAFHTFFPEPIQPIVNIFTTLLYVS